MSITIDQYKVKLRLTQEQLGTNPIGLDVMDKHIIDKQRKLIAENSSVNKAINKYLDAKTISEEQGDLELGSLRTRVEEMLGRELTPREFETLKTGDLKEFKDLKETMGELEEKGITCYFRGEKKEEGRAPIVIGSHMILGFLKAASDAIIGTRPTKKGTVLYSGAFTTSKLNQHVNIIPTMIEASNDINRDTLGNILYCQRSLRAMTAQGPRISLAKSEVLPIGTTYEFIIQVLADSPLKKEHLADMLEIGKLTGLGQWRNSGKGQFEVLEFKKM